MTLRSLRTSVSIVVAAVLLLVAPVREVSAQGDQVTWGVHVVLAPTWFDPAESSGIITPYMIYYALHDALAKPMPGQLLAPSLAESWTVSKDSLAYEFVLRSGARFHNGEPVTADDVKFSFDRYRGAAETVTMTPPSFLERHASMKVARSMLRTRVRMPTRARSFPTASAMVLKGGSGVMSPASNPLG